MLHFDQGTLFALILTLCDTFAVGGAAALLLFPGLLGTPPRRSGGGNGLDLPGTEPDPEEPQLQPEVPSSRITWSLGAHPAYAARQR